MALKLLRTIRLDPSDTFVFDRAAEPGEWAVPGGFRFFDVDPEQLTGKARQVFRAGFLGLSSFGASTLAVVVEATGAEREAAVGALAAHLVAAHGAPSLAVATTAAEDEIAFAASLADQPDGTIVALHRTVEDGALRERFRTLKPGTRPDRDFSKGGFRAFEFLEVVGEEGPDETLDITALGREQP
ncbi:DUF6505 family protein [Prosthecomicrobium hirschii]|uniref:DUF6505 family protein n=1 Tax=Prosthecodimorpha hirschii TaxID=665126 RepID=UPI00221F5074|nr:DUF6505 family protein [Prosthecomicrobium hirschii]MCW1840561.1 DUF6505 family protein [Prosthecomicrobium hirschii]